MTQDVYKHAGHKSIYKKKIGKIKGHLSELLVHRIGHAFTLNVLSIYMFKISLNWYQVMLVHRYFLSGRLLDKCSG